MTTASGPLRERTLAWGAYDRPATFEVETTLIEVPARDGTVLGCTLNRPATADGPVPDPCPGLVVEITPYVAMADLHLGEAAYFTRRGDVTIIATVRGTGRSGGTWQRAFWSQDGRDAHDVIEWLAAQPFCDGRVGQFGESYGGQTCYGSATATSARARSPTSRARSIARGRSTGPGPTFHRSSWPSATARRTRCRRGWCWRGSTDG
jgi:predicted acyl esterase